MGESIMSKTLLIDYTPFEITPQMITESEQQNNGRVIVTGVLQRAGAKNQNGRIYPKEILMREVTEYQKVQIAERRALGELDHPDSSVVELKNASHIIREAYMDGDVCHGTVEILDTPSGKILKSLVQSGVTLGISSRGVGSTRRDGDHQVVQDDFQLICWDFVSEPSTPGAFMMREGREISEAELKQVFNKTDRLNRIFNDVLEWSKE